MSRVWSHADALKRAVLKGTALDVEDVLSESRNGFTPKELENALVDAVILKKDTTKAKLLLNAGANPRPAFSWLRAWYENYETDYGPRIGPELGLYHLLRLYMQPARQMFPVQSTDDDRGLLEAVAKRYPNQETLMRWRAKGRKAPRHSATSFVVGKRMRGLDGRTWVVVKTVKSKRWRVYRKPAAKK